MEKFAVQTPNAADFFHCTILIDGTNRARRKPALSAAMRMKSRFHVTTKSSDYDEE
ncbi:hypothetical protein [Advenella incenata]|jgi:hypothetical protein|uniref:hypothetical protein n=1 Tax=Advenella incenata TaxID=267800 RepID=UPI0013EE802A|nr:hypothetical protein [Advenella incenata]